MCMNGALTQSSISSLVSVSCLASTNIPVDATESETSKMEPVKAGYDDSENVPVGQLAAESVRRPRWRS